jgi:Tol biopolymer transport system component
MNERIVAFFAALMMLNFTSYAAGQSLAGSQSGDATVVEVVGEGIVSTDRNETFPAVNPVDGSLWFSVYDNSFDAQTIMFSRQTDSRWSAPETAPFSGEWGDRAPRFSPDGSSLYFSSNRPLSGDASGGDMNLWQVRRHADGWGEAEPLGYPFNTDANDMHASVTDGALWLASTREGGFGRSDIYRVNEGGALLHLPAPVNDENSQPDLWVSADSSWMILVITNHPDGYGGDDLYLSRFDGHAWSVPENLGPEINSDEYEYGPTVSADGEYLYFTSHRGGSADVYRVSLSSVPGTSP